MHLEDDTEQKAFVVANTRSQPMWTGNSAGIWRGARQQYTHIRGQPSMHRDVRKHCAQRAAHWCTQILCAGARRRQARQAHAVWHHRDGSRCTDEKPALFPFQNSQKHNDRCHTAAGKRLMDVGISVLKRVELNRDGSGVTNTCTASRVGKRGYSLWTRGRYDRCCTHTADRRRDGRCCIHTADWRQSEDRHCRIHTAD